MAAQRRGPVVVLKVGGSALTRKGADEEKLDPAGLEALARLAGELWAREEQLRLVVVHGAGSFGHGLAARVGLSGRRAAKPDERDRAAQVLDVARVHRSVATLNGLVLDRLVRGAGLPCVGVSPLALGVAMPGQVRADGLVHRVGELLEAGFIPVLHGDVAPAGAWADGAIVVSGDLLVQELCCGLQEHQPRLLFLTDVAGVFDRPPSEPGATLLPHIRASATAAAPGSGAAKCGTVANDVTGGMALKLSAALAVAKTGVPVYVLSATDTPAAVVAALANSAAELPATWSGTALSA